MHLLRLPGRCFVLIAVLVCVATIGAGGSLTAKSRVTITSSSAFSDNLFVQWSTADPERIEVINWNPDGLTGSEPNLTNTGTYAANPCENGIAEYFGNSWAPPDPPFGSVMVGGATGTRRPGPDNKLEINSVSNDCPPVSANVAVNTTYKFWGNGEPINRMKVTRSFDFTTSFNDDFRPYIPRLFSISGFSQVLHPNAAGNSLVTESVAGFGCAFGCVVTDWAGNDASSAWFAIHNPATGQGVIVRREPSDYDVALWLDWDGASVTNSSSVLMYAPSGGFNRRVTETQYFCFYDSSIWTPSLSLPPGC